MKNTDYDVIIIGGSYAGMSASLALGRSLRKVLVIDNWDACNKKAPHSHNFLTNDGEKPTAIAFKARQELSFYQTVKLVADTAKSVMQKNTLFEVATTAETYTAKKILFATGIKDIMPKIPGFANCWGTSIIHCPYCHGYEVYNEKLAVISNGDEGFEFAKLIHNWSKQVTLFTNGPSTLNPGQLQKLTHHDIKVIESPVMAIECTGGNVEFITLADGTKHPVNAIFARVPFEQHSPIPQQLVCAITHTGHIQVDDFCATTVPGVYAAGDNCTTLRSVANAVAMGGVAGAFINKALIEEEF